MYFVVLSRRSPSSSEVKSVWNYTSTPPIRLHDVVLKYRDKFRSRNSSVV
jgi:hypothetical protein